MPSGPGGDGLVGTSLQPEPLQVEPEAEPPAFITIPALSLDHL